MGFNEDDFNEAVEDDLDDPDEEILDDPNDEEDEDYQDPNDPNVNKTETNNTTDDENKKQRSPVKKRAPKTCEKCHKTYNTQTQFRIHQRVIRIFHNMYRATKIVFRMLKDVIHEFCRNSAAICF